MATKKQKELMEIVDAKVISERERILKVMNKADIYTLTLDSLLESYLDTFEIYTTMYLRWREAGFPETQKYTNKAKATNKSKHPLAQQVETWSDKKIKALEKLGLTNKNIGKKIVGGSSAKKEELEKPAEQIKDELAEHREKWRNKG